MTGSLIETIASLNGPELKSYYRFEDIDEPGFYLNAEQTLIEHWSQPCDYTAVMMGLALRSEHGLIRDGWYSVIHGDDVETITSNLIIWKKHLIKYGVISQ